MKVDSYHIDFTPELFSGPSPWSFNNMPFGTFPQPNYVYKQDSAPTMDNPADFGHGLSNPPPVPPGVDPVRFLILTDSRPETGFILLYRAPSRGLIGAS